MYYQSGVLKQTATYKNGNRDGISKNYLENGALKQETSYKNGKRDGVMIIYNSNGSLWSTIQYQNGMPISGKCSGGKKWTNAQLNNWNKGLSVSCD